MLILTGANLTASKIKVVTELSTLLERKASNYVKEELIDNIGLASRNMTAWDMVHCDTNVYTDKKNEEIGLTAFSPQKVLNVTGKSC